MYRTVDSAPTPVIQFELPFEGKLAEDNRWVFRVNLVNKINQRMVQKHQEETGEKLEKAPHQERKKPKKTAINSNQS